MSRILFVDDEPRVLEGLEGLLRKHRRRWTMEFVAGGERALEAIALRPFDVVVTDLKMPKVDGFALLAYLEERHPETVRVVLSGQSERDSALACGVLAHQALSKPCRPGQLEAVLERSCALRELVTDPRVRRAIGAVRELPAQPGTYRRLLAVTADPSADFRAVATVVGTDMGLSAGVLKLANSAFFAGGREVATVVQAVQLLGTDAIKSLALASAFLDAPSMTGGLRLRAEALHEHSLLVASLAAELAGSAGREAFAVAMLHDVGRLVLALQDRAAPPAESPAPPVEGSATAVVDSDAHAPVGGYLLGLWGLPVAVFDAVARHHDEPGERTSAVAAAIYWAERIVDEATGGSVPDASDVAGMHRIARERAVELMRAREGSEEGVP